MVEIGEVADDELPPSEERLLDAKEIEAVASKLSRPTARMQLESLAKKLRKESDALKRLEASQAKRNEKEEEEPIVVEDVTKSASATPTQAPTPAPKPPQRPPQPPAPLPTARYIPIDTFAFDSGKYDSPTVTIYVSLEGVKEIPRENITCDFTKTSLDLIVRDLKGKSYRLFKDKLAHDIDPAASKFLVKSDRLVIKLGKTKGKYGYESWTELVSKKPRKEDKKDDPQSSIMDMMKDLYETGDDSMRKIIGETMEKQRRGDLGKGTPGLDDM
jgi:calcyclin binding protein